MKLISVDTKLPEIKETTSDFVLVYEKGLGWHVGYYCKLNDQYYWELKETGSNAISVPYEVTHWMPLPKLPTGLESA